MSKVDWRKEREIADKAQTAAIIERSGFVEVSQDDFYKVIGPLNARNVRPSPMAVRRLRNARIAWPLNK